MSPKRRNIISLLFTCLCFSKSLIIRILKRDDQLHFLRRLEHYSKKQINWESSIEFLRLCQNLNLNVCPSRQGQEIEVERVLRGLQQKRSF